jgi:hypothetical protein
MCRLSNGYDFSIMRSIHALLQEEWGSIKLNSMKLVTTQEEMKIVLRDLRFS